MGQSTFDETASQLLSTLPGIYRSVQTARLKAARDCGVSRNQMDVLSALGAASPQSVTALARHLVIAKPNVSPIVTDLLCRGFLTKEEDPRDGRVTLFRLSEAGAAIRARVRTQIAAEFQGAMEGLTEDDLASLNAGLAVLSRVLGRIPVHGSGPS